MSFGSLVSAFPMFISILLCQKVLKDNRAVFLCKLDVLVRILNDQMTTNLFKAVYLLLALVFCFPFSTFVRFIMTIARLDELLRRVIETKDVTFTRSQMFRAKVASGVRSR